MAIPYLLVDQIDERGTYLRKDAGHYDRLRIEVKRARVASVDTKTKQLALEGGDTLGYDKLLIATGSSPIVPPVPGIDRDGVHSCWTLQDARWIMRRARPGAKVVLLGAGFIGSIILEALARRGTELTVVEMHNRMVPRMMNETAGGLIKRWCEEKGVQVHTSTKVTSIEEGRGGHALTVHLDNGHVVDADLVISAAGVRSNVEFLRGSGLQLDQGVLVDRHLQTSAPDVYAAGDAAQGLDFSTGQCVVQAVQPTAADHALIAAGNMSGHEVVHRGSVVMNVLDTMGLISTSFGLWMGVDGGESAELKQLDRYRYLNLQFQDDRLIGASSLGLTDHVGVLRGLIQTGVRLKGWKDKLMQDPTRLMEAYLACTQPVGYNARVV